MNPANIVLLDYPVSADLLSSTGVVAEFETIDSPDWAFIGFRVYLLVSDANTTVTPHISIGLNDPDYNDLVADVEVVGPYQYVDCLPTFIGSPSTIKVNCISTATADTFSVSFLVYLFSLHP